MKKTIEIGFDTWKRLVQLLQSPNDSEDSVINKLLDASQITLKSQVMWKGKNVELPEGTELRKIMQSDTSYAKKGSILTAKIKEGKIFVQGKAFDTPSAAAFSIVDHGINGWDFWQVRLPDTNQWVGLNELREKAKKS